MINAKLLYHKNKHQIWHGDPARRGVAHAAKKPTSINAVKQNRLKYLKNLSWGPRKTGRGPYREKTKSVLKLHNRTNRFAFMHVGEGIINLFKRHGVGDHVV